MFGLGFGFFTLFVFLFMQCRVCRWDNSFVSLTKYVKFITAFWWDSNTISWNNIEILTPICWNELWKWLDSFGGSPPLLEWGRPRSQFGFLCTKCRTHHAEEISCDIRWRKRILSSPKFLNLIKRAEFRVHLNGQMTWEAGLLGLLESHHCLFPMSNKTKYLVPILHNCDCKFCLFVWKIKESGENRRKFTSPNAHPHD